MYLMVKNIDLARKLYQKNISRRYIKGNYIKQINDTQEWRKKKMAEKGHVWKESEVTTQRRRDVEVGSLLLDNDKSNVIADKNF